MTSLGSSTIYKLVFHSDGSPNWSGIVILVITLLVVFVWRCVFFVPENWVAVRKRFNRVVRDKAGNPVEYDPLATRSNGSGKQVRSVRFRFYLVNSLHPVNCGDRNTPLDIDGVTIDDIDYKVSIGVLWRVSRDLGCPTKSILQPAESTWKWRNSKDELEDLVRSHVQDGVLRAYDELKQEEHYKLPLLTVQSDLGEVAEKLYERYGIEVISLNYGDRMVAPARRKLEGYLAIAKALREIAKALSGT